MSLVGQCWTRRLEGLVLTQAELAPPAQDVVAILRQIAAQVQIIVRVSLCEKAPSHTLTIHQYTA